MIARDDQHLGPFLQQHRQRRVEILDGFFLRLEIAVLAVHVGVLEVDEEEVVIVVFRQVTLELFGDGLRAFDLGHAHQLRQSLVHWVNSQAGGLELIAFLKQRNGRLMGDAAQQKAVGRTLPRDDRQRGLEKLGQQFRRFPLTGGFRIDGFGHRHRHSFPARVRVRQRAFQTRPAQDDHETMSLARLDDDLGVADFFDLAGEHAAQFLGDFRVNPSRAAVGHDTFGVQRAKIGAGGDIAGLQLHPQSERLNHAAPDRVFQRIIPEQPQMPRPAARSDARGDRNHAPLGADAGQRIEVRGAGRFERRHKILFRGGQIAQTVQHDEDDFGFGLDRQF